MIKRKITTIFVVFMAFTSLINNHAFSQGKIHLGPLEIYPTFGERIEVDDNVFQISGKGTVNGRREAKQSDLINIYTPGLKLKLPIRGGGFIPGIRHDLNLDWHSDFLNYRDHASENQQNHYFFVSGNLIFPKGFEISLEDNYEDTASPASSEIDQIHARTSNTGSITINMPDYFRRFDAEISYSHFDQEYDERALKSASRFEQKFTLKIPYKIAPKIKIFPEYTYGFIEYDNAPSDSHLNEIYAGVEWAATFKTTGILKLGFIFQDYDNIETSDIKTFIAQIGVRVDLTRRMQLDINAGRGPSESEFTENSSSFERSFGDFSISRQVWKDLSVSFNGNYEKQVFHGSPKKDDIYGLGLSSRYDINKRMFVDFKYSYRDKHSNIELQSDRVNKASVGIQFAF